MARAPDVIIDESPLNAPVINVPLRVGWLLRTCRLNSRREPGMSGHRFAKELGVGAAMVTKWEKGSDPIDAASIAGYERLVHLPEGSLRGLVETTRRYFRYPIGTRVGADPLPDDLAALTELVHPSMAGTPRGVDWLHLADALATGGPFLLPEFVAEPVVDRLASELGRAVGGAFLTRYEAMARLRTGPYADVVRRSLLRHALADDAQTSVAHLSVLAQAPSADLFETMIGHLLDPREAVFHGAAQSLVTMAVLGGVPKTRMRDAVPHLVGAYNGLADDPARHGTMSALLRNLPPGVLEAARPGLAQPLTDVPTIHRACERAATVSAAARRVADAVKADLPSPVDQVLERLLHEAMFDPRWPKAHIAVLFLAAVPYVDLVARHVATLAESHEAKEVRDAASLLVLRLGQRSTEDDVERWVVGEDVRLQRTALVNLGMWGDDLDGALLEKLVLEPWDVARLALYAAGMSRHGVLEEWARDGSRDEQLRAGARWWLRHGGRVTD